MCISRQGATVFLLCLLVAGAAFGEDIELIDGTVMKGAIQEVRDSVVVVKLPAGLSVHVPRKFLTLMQNYRLMKWRLSSDDKDPADPQVQEDYGAWCLEKIDFEPRLKELAKRHLDQAVKLDPDRAKRIRELIEANGYRIHPNDPSQPWVTEKEWHELRGDVWDEETQKWYTQPEWEKIQKQRERDIKKRLLSTTKVGEYFYATPSLILGNLLVYRNRRVRVWGRVASVLDKDFDALTFDGVKYTPGSHVRLILEGADFPFVFFSAKNKKLLKKIMKFAPGDRALIYAMVRIGTDRFILEGADIIIK